MLTPSEVISLVRETESAENHKRKRDEYKSYQMYEGNLRYFVADRLKEMYPSTHEMFTVSDYSVMKKIIDKKSKAYKEPPVRRLGTEAETQRYNDLLKRFNFNRSMQRLDVLKNQHKYCLLAVFFERVADHLGKIKEQFKFIPLAPYEFDVVLNEMGELQTVILSYPGEEVVIGPATDGVDSLIAGNVMDHGRQTKLYAVWTKESHYVIQSIKSNSEERYEIVQNDKNPDNKNPYGILPFVYLPFDFSSDYPIASPLPYQTVELNAEMSTYYTSGSMQIGTLVLKYPTSQAIEAVVNGLFTGMKLPQSENPDAPSTDAEYISPSPNMGGHREAIVTHMLAILDEQGINSNQVISPNEKFASGFDRLIANADVQDIIESNQEIYYMVEQKVFEIVAAIHRNFIKRDMFSSESLQIVYKKPKVMISETEKLQNLEKMESLNVLLPWEKFQFIDPNLSEDEAKAKWELQRQAKMELLGEIIPSEENDDVDATPGVGSAGAADNVQQQALNGAQVASLIEIVEKVAMGTLPRESAVNIIGMAYNISGDEAEKILASAGKGFKPVIPEPQGRF